MIYLIYSKDKEILEKYIEKLIEKENIDQNSIIKYSLDTDNVFDIIEECNTIGLFSIKKLILLESTNALSSKGKEITELNKYLDNYNKDIIIVFTCNSEKVDTRKSLYKKISTIGKVECLNKDKNYLVNLVKEKLEDYKMEDINYFIKKEDINYFIKVVGTNINNIENEIEKLKNYKYKEKIITKQDINDLCEVSIEEEIFSLTDAIIKNDNNRAIKLYKHFLNQKNPYTKKNYEVSEIINLVSNQFRFLLQVKILYNKRKTNDEITAILKANPYRVELAVVNCYYYKRESLEYYLIKLFELDKKIKLGLIDKDIFFQLFILNKDI